MTGATLAGFLVVFPLFYLEFGLLQDLLLSTVFGAGVSGYCALRKDVVGKVTRDIAGGTTNLAVVNVVQRAEEIAEEYNLRDARARAADQAARGAQGDGRGGGRRRRRRCGRACSTVGWTSASRRRSTRRRR